MLVITTKSPYALKALCELARRGDEGPVPIAEIARARDIPVQFLEGLFATLRRGGILQSQRGVKGGYQLARPPEEINLLEVVELLEGELGQGASEHGPIWEDVVRAVRDVLASQTLRDAVEREAHQAGATMYWI
ncbi:RrF2 family transcriptional regulator [Thermoleophilum album]|uniref:Transcriptional regulator, BadM/Rrf2 family n=1 Tax=Thermoleophilum album TaxID=29539 RepID=A0A1H6FW01_THEAL|nr:Rrf2 family transcriptional regulator [Thermoleophilum album]SEH14969.1 transcriptional regulator, BadM/Rrf2 family [Thermoleophilum album]